MKLARPEQQLQQAVATWLELAGVSSRAIWFHVPNGGARTAVEAKILKSMGVRPGVADLVFIWRGEDGPRVGFIELKAPSSRAKPSEFQQQFRADCEWVGAPYEIARSIEEVDAALKRMGVPRRVGAPR